MTTFSPREIVSELDRFIVGQDEAKRAVSVMTLAEDGSLVEDSAADLRLTPFVVLGQPGKPGHCQAWMDAADRLCARPTDGHLCRRHRTVATKRRAARLAEIEARHGIAPRDLVRGLALVGDEPGACAPGAGPR